MAIGFNFDFGRERRQQRALDLTEQAQKRDRQAQRDEQRESIGKTAAAFGLNAPDIGALALLAETNPAQAGQMLQGVGVAGGPQAIKGQRAAMQQAAVQAEQDAAFKRRADRFQLQADQAEEQRKTALAPFQLAQADFAAQSAEMGLLELQGRTQELPQRATISTIEPGTGAVIPRVVDTPASPAYQDNVDTLSGIFRNRDKLTELTELVQKFGTEFTGPNADRMDALHADAVLGYADAKGMGALQKPDMELASQIIVNPTDFGRNVSGVLRSTIGAPSAVKGLITGEPGGFLGLSRQDQIEGIKQAYAVAKDDMDSNIVRAIERNPLLLSALTDAQIAAIAPDIGAPLVPYLEAMGRNPWQTLEQ